MLLCGRLIHVIPDRRLGEPITFLKALAHSGRTLLLSKIILKLIEKEEHVFHKLARHIIRINRLGNRNNVDALRLQIGLRDDSFCTSAGESVVGINQDDVNTFIHRDVCDHLLVEFSLLFSTLICLSHYPVYFNVIPLSILKASFLLGLQT